MNSETGPVNKTARRKVFVVCSNLTGMYEPTIILGIFDDSELAQSFANREDGWIEEYELNPEEWTPR